MGDVTDMAMGAVLRGGGALPGADIVQGIRLLPREVINLLVRELEFKILQN